MRKDCTDEVYEVSDAWEVFNRSIEKIKFPQNVFVHKKEDGSASFLIGLSSHHGSGHLVYLPDVSYILETLTTFRANSTKVVGEKMAAESAEVITTALIYGLMKNLHVDLLEAFQD
jgi:hypothetical protein